MLKSGAMTQIETLDEFLSYGFDLTDTLIQDIDFRDADIPWEKYICKNTFFTGCKFSKQATVGLIFEKGGFAFPKFNDLPYNAYRSGLYSPFELMEGYDPENDRSLDRRIYDHFVAKGRHSPDIAEALSQRIHDHAIDEALDDLLETHQAKVVGIMGGHSCKRDSIYYKKIARLARMLTLEGYL